MATKGWARIHVGCDITGRDRVERDLYTTPTKAVEELVTLEKFQSDVWEPACGTGSISGVLSNAGYRVRNSDIYPEMEDAETLDFFNTNEVWDGDIITNPPYAMSLAFVQKALSVVKDGAKVCMFLPITFLETKKRTEWFKTCPPTRVYIARMRLACNSPTKQFKGSAVCYAWIIWEKGWRGEPILRWFN